jgi:hypothetical protein
MKHPEYEPSLADEFVLLDPRRMDDCVEATRDVEEVYALAADMGGMGSSHRIMHRYFVTML